MKFAYVVPALLLVTGCSGTVVMSPMSPDEVAAGYDQKTDVTGIIVYRPIPLVEVDQFIQVSVPGPDGKTPVVSGDCNKVLTRKIVSVADTQHPYRLHYEHGLLETYTFGATLTSDGILTVINSQSTPDQGKTLQNIGSAATSFGSVAALAIVPGPKPDCTMTPVFRGYEAYPLTETKKFGDIN